MILAETIERKMAILSTITITCEEIKLKALHTSARNQANSTNGSFHTITIRYMAPLVLTFYLFGILIHNFYFLAFKY